MANMPATSYILVGTFVLILSIYVTKNTDNNFTIFAIVGAIMLVYGILKKLSEKRKKNSLLYQQRMQREAQQSQGFQGPVIRQNSRHGLAVCPYCGNHVRSMDRFCSNCGARIR